MPRLRKALKLGQAMVWHHFIPVASQQGEDWYRRYIDAGGDTIGGRLDVGVLAVRRGEEEEGKKILLECYAAVDALDGIDPSIVRVLRISCLSAQAFCHYHGGELESAEKVLDACEALVAETLEIAPFLVPLASRCCEFYLHRMRLFRDQRRWPEMWRSFEEGRRMVSGQAPLCRGTEQDLYMEDVCDFYRSIEPADDIERQALDLLSRQHRRLQAFENRALGATIIPNLVVSYP